MCLQKRFIGDDDEFVIVRNAVFFQREIVGLRAFQFQFVNLVIPKRPDDSIDFACHQGRGDIRADVYQLVIAFC